MFSPGWTHLRQDMLGMEQVDGLDVAEDGGDDVLAEHVMGSVLPVDSEVEHLQLLSDN